MAARGRKCGGEDWFLQIRYTLYIFKVFDSGNLFLACFSDRIGINYTSKLWTSKHLSTRLKHWGYRVVFTEVNFYLLFSKLGYIKIIPISSYPAKNSSGFYVWQWKLLRNWMSWREFIGWKEISSGLMGWYEILIKLYDFCWLQQLPVRM